MTNRYLTKIAELTAQHKKELMDTGIIAGAGALGNIAADKALPLVFKDLGKNRALKVGLMGGAIGLGADYAAVKLNNAIGKHLSRENK